MDGDTGLLMVRGATGTSTTLVGTVFFCGPPSIVVLSPIGPLEPILLLELICVAWLIGRLIECVRANVIFENGFLFLLGPWLNPDISYTS